MLALIIIGVLFMLMGGWPGIFRTGEEMVGTAFKIIGGALAVLFMVPLMLLAIGGSTYKAKPFGRTDLILGCAIGALMAIPIFSWLFLK